MKREQNYISVDLEQRRVARVNSRLPPTPSPASKRGSGCNMGIANGLKCLRFAEAKVDGGGGDTVAGKARKPEPSCWVTMGNYTDSQGISKVPAQLSLGSAKEPDAGAE